MNLRVLKLLGRLFSEETDETKPGPLHGGKAWVNLLLVLSTILLCALSTNAVFTVGILTAELLLLALLPARKIARILKGLVLPVLFTLILCLPAVFLGNPGTMLTVSMKVCESVLALLLMNEALSWKEVTGAFSDLHFPQIFVLILDQTVRFLVLLGRYSNAICEAVTLRMVGGLSAGMGAEAQGTNFAKLSKHARQHQLGGVLGTTFLRSERMAMQSAEAMECRCFDGTYRRHARSRWRVPDILRILLIPLEIVLYVNCERAMGV